MLKQYSLEKEITTSASCFYSFSISFYMERQTAFCRLPFPHYFLTYISCFLQLVSQILLFIVNLFLSNYSLDQITASVFVLVCITKDFFQKFYFNVMAAGTKGILSQDFTNFVLSKVSYFQCFYLAAEADLQT